MYRALVVAVSGLVSVGILLVATMMFVPLVPIGVSDCATCELVPQQPFADQQPFAGQPTMPTTFDVDVTAPFELTAQVLFAEPRDAVVTIESIAPGGSDRGPVTIPGRSEFTFDAQHVLTISHLPGNPSIDIRALLYIAPETSQTMSYLRDMAIPIIITLDEVDAVREGGSFFKVVFLPSDASSGTGEQTETLTGQGPEAREKIKMEAESRGTLIAILEMECLNKPTTTALEKPAL